MILRAVILSEGVVAKRTATQSKDPYQRYRRLLWRGNLPVQTVVVRIPLDIYGGAKLVGVLRLRKDFASRSSYCAQDDRVIFFSTPGAQSQSRGEWARSHLWTDQLQLQPSTSLPAGWLLRNPESETAFLPCARAFAG